MFCFPPRRILVAVDFTDASQRAFRAAKLTAKRFGAHVEAVHCDAPTPPEISLYGSPAMERARKRRLAARLRELYGTADVLHTVTGDPAEMIVGMIRRRRPDLVVMGTNGRRGLNRAVLGSVAETVLRRSTAPVLITRLPLRTLHRVLAPVGQDRDAQDGLLAAGLVARAFKARLDALCVVEDPALGAAAKSVLSERIKDLPEEVRRATKPCAEVRVGRPVPEIRRAACDRDLLVLLARPKSLLGDLFFGTTAQRLARTSPVPLLAIPAAKRRTTTLI